MDVGGTGLTQLLTGRRQETMTNQALANALGEKNAEDVIEAVEIGGMVAGGIGLVKMLDELPEALKNARNVIGRIRECFRRKPGRPIYDGDMVPAPGRGLGSKAPDQVTPKLGGTVLEGQYVDDLGQIQPWHAAYDDFGRQIERTDFTDLPAGTHPNPHHHTREYGPGYGPKGKEDEFPGPGSLTGSK